MIEEFESTLYHLMSNDEIEIYEQLCYGEEFEEFYQAYEARRKKMNELDRLRITKFEYQPEKIQAVFNRLGLSLEIKHLK